MKAMVTSLALCAFATPIACDTGGADPYADGTVGVAELSLRAPAVGGGHMRLTGATLEFRNNGTLVESVNADGGQTAQKVRLPAGAYTVELTGAWQLQLELDSSLYDAGDFEVVENPKSFNLASGGTAAVEFSFRRQSSVTVTLDTPSRLASGHVAFSYADGTLLGLDETTAGFDWTVRAATSSVVSIFRRLEFTDETFIWADGAPPALTALYQDYPSASMVRRLDLSHYYPEVRAQMVFEVQYDADLVQLIIDGFGPEHPVDSQYIPLAVPFCTGTEATVTLRHIVREEGTGNEFDNGIATGTGQLCWD